MFNDDVAARCPECGSPDVSYTAEKIRCQACAFEETFKFDFRKTGKSDDAALDAINRSQAMAVLQRWDFAG